MWAEWCIPLHESISAILWSDGIVSLLLCQPTGNSEGLVISGLIIRKCGQKSNGLVPLLGPFPLKKIKSNSVDRALVQFSSLLCMRILEPRTPSPKEVLYQTAW